MGVFRSIGGSLTVEVISANVAGTLMKVNQEDIVLSKIIFADMLTFRADIARKDYSRLLDLVKRQGDQIRIVQKRGLFWSMIGLLHRPVLLGGIVLPVLLTVILPRHVLFFQVEGNAYISEQQVLEKAEECGIRFGISRRTIRSEQLKNSLLESIPQLQWAGINTYGCVAVISVREKIAAENEVEENRVCSIIAARDGVVRECTVQQGNLLCRVGQAVKSGQVLVSGYTDCGLMIKATHAKAEIYADTIHDLIAVSPDTSGQRGEIVSSKTKYSIIIGKKLINLYKDSGIWDTSCVKIYKQKNMTLPGGFRLPIGIIQETWIEYSLDSEGMSDLEDVRWMEAATKAYLNCQMIAGRIVEKSESVQINEGVYLLRGRYACVEMIGKVKNEEIITKDAKND